MMTGRIPGYIHKYIHSGASIKRTSDGKIDGAHLPTHLYALTKFDTCLCLRVFVNKN
jgi:hypothetical protein